MSSNRPTTSSQGGHDDTPAIRATTSTDQVADSFSESLTDPALAPLLAALTSSPVDRELEGLAPALTAYRTHVASPSHRTKRRRSMLSSLAGAKLGATIAAAAVTIGGAATVAYVQTANDTAPNSEVTAPPTSVPSADPTQNDEAGASATHGTPVGPDATGSAAYGLCTAWKGVAAAGKAMDSVAFKNLVEAAGGEDKVATFCAAVPAPGESGAHATNKPTSTPTGKPADVPTTHAVTPTERPTSTPTERPDTAPTTHATGRP